MTTIINEESWVLTGDKVGGIWVGTRRWRSEGEPHSVTVPWDKIMSRHKFQGDLCGFAHTHPTFPPTPSSLDIQCMQSMVWTFGKPLICTIIGRDEVNTYLFDHDESTGIKLMKTYLLDYGIIIAVEHGRSSRRETMHSVQTDEASWGLCPST